MTNSNTAKLLLSGITLLSLSGCGLASLPGGYTPMEKQTVQDLSIANYTPRSAEDREAILTQDLFAQAAFWSREYDLNPADLEAAINLASTLRRLGNPHNSVEIAQTTRALYPRDVNLMAELAAAHIADNNPGEAISIIDKALAQRSDMARLWSLKGAALDQFEQFAEARQNYSRALGLAPNDPSVIANVGLSYALEGDPKTAEIWLRRAANMPGASAGVRQNLALVLGLQNKYDEAEKWARRDLDAQSAANNMSYIRTLRGTSSPVTEATVGGRQKMAGAASRISTYALRQRAPRQQSPQQMAPQQMISKPTSSLTPRTYGGAAQAAPNYTRAAKPSRPSANYQRASMSPNANSTPSYTIPKVTNQLSKLSNYEQQKQPSMRLSMAGDVANYDGGPKTSRDIALAVANKTPIYGPTRNGQSIGQATVQKPAAALPQNVLGQISQKNIPKTAIAQRQRQQLAGRFQSQQQAAQQQAQQQALQQMGQYQNYPPRNIQAPDNRMTGNAAPVPYANGGYQQPQAGYNYTQAQMQAQIQAQAQARQQNRIPARQRRR